jgi:hypothetical protein
MDGCHPNTNHLGPEDRCDIVRGAVEGREYKVLLKLRVDVCLVNMSRVGCLFSRFRVFAFSLNLWKSAFTLTVVN